MKIQVYSDTLKSEWDAFVRQSKNGTFLFLRDYMEYHRDRFQDYSLLIRDEHNTLLAVMPAHQRDSFLQSHGGLTYGGFVTAETMKVPKMLEVFEATLIWLQERGFSKLLYKTIPHLYHRFPAEEDRYALFLLEPRVARRGVLAVVDTQHRLPFQERRTRGVKRAKQNGLYVRPSDDFKSYWKILTERIWKTYQVRPVHTLPEIELLHTRFPEHIKLFCCYQDATLLAGVVIFESARVARAQYIAANDPGLELGALDLLFAELLETYFSTKPFFDFGTSDENDGRVIKQGLIEQKEGFGARAVMHDHYEIVLADFKPGQLIGVLR